MIPSTYPGKPPLESRFMVPTDEQYHLNETYWDAYKAEQDRVNRDCPSATGVPTHPEYSGLLADATGEVAPWNTAAVGWKQCIMDAGGWEWDSNPKSGKNTVYP